MQHSRETTQVSGAGAETCRALCQGPAQQQNNRSTLLRQPRKLFPKSDPQTPARSTHTSLPVQAGGEVKRLVAGVRHLQQGVQGLALQPHSVHGLQPGAHVAGVTGKQDLKCTAAGGRAGPHFLQPHSAHSLEESSGQVTAAPPASAEAFPAAEPHGNASLQLWGLTWHAPMAQNTTTFVAHACAPAPLQHLSSTCPAPLHPTLRNNPP